MVQGSHGSILLGAFALLLLNFSNPSEAHAREIIKVAILRQKSPITIKGGPFQITDGSTQVDVQTNPLKISSKDRKLHLHWEKGDAVVRSGARIVSVGLPIQVDRHPYRGEVVLHSDGGSRILAVNELDLEDYVRGIINHEVSSKWPLEAVKAQVVAARSYALSRRGKPKDTRFDVEATVMDQVYRGSSREDDAAAQAVLETEGLVLTQDGEVIEAYYHSCCGGQTEASGTVWGRERSYLQGVTCGFDQDCPNAYWEVNLSTPEIEREVGIKNIESVEVASLQPSGRVRRIRFVTPSREVSLTGKEFRERVGFNRIPSTHFKIVRQAKGYKFMGSGSGHGVGLCQWGARGMAQEGHTFEEILKKYYSGVEITKLY
ncbi:MAG: SpoIID/LytB domain-containing protein [Nitrospirae bacterium]|nr:SpoIID/LytB domain-containing protein [Nitrospirota bacterium]